MLHIYRQIKSLERVRPVVIAQKRENADQFPFDRVYTVGKPATHFLRRFWFRQIWDAPWQISKFELDLLLRILTKTEAQLLHIYFGHIGVHLLPLIRAWPKPTIVSFHGADVLVDMNKPAYRRATKEMLDAVRHVLVRSESLGRAVADLGCDENKIDILRTRENQVIVKVEGQLIRTGVFSGQTFAESPKFTLNLTLVRNPDMLANKRYPLAVWSYDYTLN